VSQDPIEVRVAVAATPEQVWEAIATGPGISAWFMPAEVDEREGGEIVQRHAPGDDGVSRGIVTAHEPPERFVYEERFVPEPGAEEQVLATEFLVEARSGGGCVVRIVSHGLADDADFGLVEGWTQALAVLKLRLERFAGLPAASARVWHHPDGDLDAAWRRVAGDLGLAGVAEGARATARDGAPALAGVVAAAGPHRAVVRREDEDGVVGLIATDFGGRTAVVADLYCYGDEAGERVAAHEAGWRRWLLAR
jgi:uncharacterized protein YndB with AHSA1/START domain